MSVRVEWYGIGGYGGVSLPGLRVRGQHWASDVADTDEYDDEDAIPTEVGLVFAGDEVGVLAGTVDELRMWIDAADRALRAHEHARAESWAAGRCSGVGEHEWTLKEDGYLRTWHTTVTTDEQGTVTGVRAAFTGTESFSEAGDGVEYLGCDNCAAQKAIPDDVEVDYV